MPKRVQLSRAKGWKMPPNTVKVDRTTRWGNPWRIGEPYVGDASDAVRMFRARIFGTLTLGVAPESYLGRIRADIGQLRGKNLACWCKLPAPGEPDVCHAAVLLELANAEPPNV